MKQIFILGRFNPPNKTDRCCIEKVIIENKNYEIHIFICEKENDIPKGELRMKWIQEWNGFNNNNIYIYVIQGTYDDNDNDSWHTLCKTKSLITNPLRIINLPNDEYNLDKLEGSIRSYYIPKIILVGAESTGKTTLAKKLLEKYGSITVYVPEYLRIWCEEAIKDKHNSKTIPIFKFTEENFVDITLKQKQLEYEASCNNDKNIKFILCDTDVFALSIWHERYMKNVSEHIENMGKQHANETYNQIYLLTDNTVPFVQDGYRDGEHIRDWMFNRFLGKLKNEKKIYHVLTGSYEDRFEKAQSIINELIGN